MNKWQNSAAKMATLFEFLDSINTSKKDLMIDVQNEKEYLPFMINRGLSLFHDTCLLANEMNKYPDLSKRMQYDFYLHGVTKKKRFSKWHTKEKESSDLKMLAEHMQCSYEKARVYLGLLNESQMNEIRETLNHGGRQ